MTSQGLPPGAMARHRPGQRRCPPSMELQPQLSSASSAPPASIPSPLPRSGGAIASKLSAGAADKMPATSSCEVVAAIAAAGFSRFEEAPSVTTLPEGSLAQTPLEPFATPTRLSLANEEDTMLAEAAVEAEREIRLLLDEYGSILLLKNSSEEEAVSGRAICTCFFSAAVSGRPKVVSRFLSGKASDAVLLLLPPPPMVSSSPRVIKVSSSSSPPTKIFLRRPVVDRWMDASMDRLIDG